MRLDGVDDDGVFLVLPGKVGAQLHMAALHLVVDGLAQVMQKTCPLCQGHIHAQLRSHQSGNVRHLDGVVQHVLTVRGAVLLTTQNLHQLRVQVVHAGFVAGSLAFLPDGAIHLFPSLLHHILNAGRMDPAVGNELLQSQPGNLPADGIEAGNGDGLGSVVDNQVNTGDGFESADIPALPADDPALHFIVGQGDHGHGCFGGMIGGAPLDGGGDDLPTFFLGLVLQLLLDLLDLHGSLVTNLVLHVLQQALLGLILGQLGDFLQLFQLLLADGLGLVLGLGDLLEPTVQLLFLALIGLGFLVEGGFLLFQTALLLAQLGAALLDFLFVLCA